MSLLRDPDVSCVRGSCFKEKQLAMFWVTERGAVRRWSRRSQSLSRPSGGSQLETSDMTLLTAGKRNESGLKVKMIRSQSEKMERRKAEDFLLACQPDTCFVRVSERAAASLMKKERAHLLFAGFGSRGACRCLCCKWKM